MFGFDTSRIGPSYVLFFAPLEVEFDQKTLESIQFAYTVSKYGHHPQKRDDGSRYFDHSKELRGFILMNLMEGILELSLTFFFMTYLRILICFHHTE